MSCCQYAFSSSSWWGHNIFILYLNCIQSSSLFVLFLGFNLPSPFLYSGGRFGVRSSMSVGFVQVGNFLVIQKKNPGNLSLSLSPTHTDTHMCICYIHLYECMCVGVGVRIFKYFCMHVCAKLFFFHMVSLLFRWASPLGRQLLPHWRLERDLRMQESSLRYVPFFILTMKKLLRNSVLECAAALERGKVPSGEL